MTALLLLGAQRLFGSEEYAYSHGIHSRKKTHKKMCIDCTTQASEHTCYQEALGTG